MDDCPLPVRLRSFAEIGARDYQCELRKLDGSYLGKINLSSEFTPAALRVLRVATLLYSPNKRSSTKAICSIVYSKHDVSRSTLGLYIQVIWMNSKSLRDARSDAQNDFLASLAPGDGYYKVQPWSPRDFYDSVHVPSKNVAIADMQVEGLVCQLYPFQNRAVQWLLAREGADGFCDKAASQSSQRTGLPHGFFHTADVDGRSCWISHWLGIVTTEATLLVDAESRINGGILAEEMGLGKTVEVIALICMHKRAICSDHSPVFGSGLWQSSSTLIITPPSIIQQWKGEIQSHAPGLKVMIYEGIRASDKDGNEDETLQQLLDHDIVLTTYHTLANEIHYSTAIPERSLRHEKKYGRRQSPLVQIEWWRVVLDECQMVESGVSNAAKVAQLIPRRNAWAVSGTPLKKDAKDLLGLLIFLRLEPYCLSLVGWLRLVTSYKPIFKQLFGSIALRHTKEQVKGDIQLPPQKRVVLSIPFTQIEEQHYSTLYQQMCEECDLDLEGQPLTEDWNPDSSIVVERMRTWLTRLRQTCLHPEVGDRNRRALGHGDGPLRTVGEVLDVMIEQNETANRTEERSYLLSKLRRGQILEHANKSQEALAIWLEVQAYVKVIVEDCRKELRPVNKSFEKSSADSVLETDNGNNRVLLRLRLRSALELEHISTFFVANGYFQIKSDENITPPESDRFKELEVAETETYEKAKLLRKEMLTETQSKADSFMSIVRNKTVGQAFTEIPNFGISSLTGGIESRNVLARLADLCETLNEQAEQVDEWREKMIEMLLLPLVDQEDNELQGDEYETSTKQQDEVYVYMEALRAVVADRHDALTGQTNFLIRGEMATALQQAKRREGHSPELMQRLLAERSKAKPKNELGSVRGIITELRSLKVTLRAQEERGSSRAATEIAMINKALDALQLDSARQSKAVISLEKELELFRDTMNARLEYYRQLQTISDTVAPYEEDMDNEALQTMLLKFVTNETKLQEKIAALKARGRYLMHLRTESTAENVQRKCIICQEAFEIGALTSCGHSYCKECLRLWWNAHRNCPTCKKHLSRNDLHQIT